jgi:hypothetical protein
MVSLSELVSQSTFSDLSHIPRSSLNEKPFGQSNTIKGFRSSPHFMYLLQSFGYRTNSSPDSHVESESSIAIILSEIYI